MITIAQYPLELKFPKGTQLSDEEFFLFCQENKELKLERTKDGNIVVMTSTGSETGNRNTEIITDLNNWNRQTNYGRVFDSSSGFTLPDGSVLSPDASIIAHHRWDQLTKEERKKFAPICPEFVVELRPDTDQLSVLQTKMQNWLSNGVKLGWLIDPVNEQVFIYQPDSEVKLVEGFDQVLTGDTVLAGFQFELKLLQ